MNLLRYCIAALLILATLPQRAATQTFGTPLLVSRTPTGNDHSPEMHIGRDGTIFVSWFSANADIYFAHSDPGTGTFSVPVHAVRQVTTNNYTSLLQRAPEFVIDTKGTIHLVWTEDRMKGQSDVFYIRSTDKGATWTAPASIMDAGDSMKYAQDFCAIACDSANNLYVSYLDNRYLERGIGIHYRMHMQKSTDGGATWSKPVIADKLPVANSGTCECCRQDIAVSPEGHVYIAFRSNIFVTPTNNRRMIFIARSMDGGLTFDSSILAQLGIWTINACPTTGPHIVLDKDENLHLTWRDNRDDSSGSNTYYTLLRKGDNTVFPNYKLNDASELTNWPDVTVDQNGVLAATYMSGGNLMLTTSSDGGNNWSTTTPYPTTGQNRQLPINRFGPDGALYSVWQQDAADGGDIYFSKIGGLPTPIILDTVTINTQKSYPPNKPITITWSTPNNLPLASSVWYDVGMVTIRGRLATLPGLPVGSYSIPITAHTANSMSITRTTIEVSASGVKDLRGATKLITYPVPSRVGEAVTVSLPVNADQNFHCELFDSKGSAVRTWDCTAASNLTIATTGLAPGTYYCAITGTKASYTVELVVK